MTNRNQAEEAILCHQVTTCVVSTSCQFQDNGLAHLLHPCIITEYSSVMQNEVHKTIKRSAKKIMAVCQICGSKHCSVGKESGTLAKRLSNTTTAIKF